MEQELADTKEEKRLAEFAEARAEQLAIARGEALYKCQERLTEAERQQVQLADVLKLTLDKLGMGLTPSPAPMSSQEYQRSPGQLLDRPAGPLFASAHGLAIDTSTTMLAPRNTTDVAAIHNQQHSASEPDTPLSGFTVYSNELHESPAADGVKPHSRADSPTYHTNNNSDRANNENGQQQQRQYVENPRPRNATNWRDISEVVQRSSNSQSPDCVTPCGPVAVNSNGNGALAVAGTNNSQLHADLEADRLAKLIIPHLEASQLESLVRFGASLGSPTLASPTMQRHLIDALRKSRTEERREYHDHFHQQQKEQQLMPAPQMPVAHHDAPERFVPFAMPAPAQCVQPRPSMQQYGGPLSQAAGWTSPGLNGSSAHHIKTVFENAPGGSGVGTGGENGFYKPFSAAAAIAPETNNYNNNTNQEQDGVAMPAPRPKKTTFKINTATARAGQQQQHAVASPFSQDGDTIKAVMQQGIQLDERIITNDGVPEDDRFARQRRAAERLAAKINSKLPPEYQTADPLGLRNKGQQTSRNASATNVVASRSTSSTSTRSSGGTGAKRAPKGSLRRQQTERYCLAN
jgi:hypothetical protein